MTVPQPKVISNPPKSRFSFRMNQIGLRWLFAKMRAREEGGRMKPLEAYHVISDCMNELASIRSSICGKGYSQEEVTAQVVCFEALRRMEEDELGRQGTPGEKGKEEA